MHRLAVHNAGGLELEGTAAFDTGDFAKAVDRLTQRVDHAAEVSLTYRHREHLTSAGNFHTLDDAAEGAEHDSADYVFFEVLRETERTVGEANELVRHYRGQALDTRDTVSSADHRADFGRRRTLRTVRVRKFAERDADLVRIDRKF